MAESFDVLVVGGGPVGCAIARALSGSPLKVGLIEPAPSVATDSRPIALSHGSRLVLERLDCWQGIEATTIVAIHVSQQNRFGRTRMTREEHKLPALGYVAAYGELRKALLGRIDCARIEGQVLAIENRGEFSCARMEAGQHEARLVVLAEGGQLIATQNKDYGQVALVAHVDADQPNAGRAWERFTPEGPLALLPFGAGYALVWSMRAATASSLSRLDEHDFLKALQHAFGQRAGRFTAVGPRANFPLALRRAQNLPPRSVAVGNAAQTLHPVAGQGMNIGLRDGAELARQILDAAPRELGSPQFVASYLARRESDRSAGVWVTDTLVRLFSNSDPLAGFARGAGLFLLDMLPAPRHFLARRMMYGARALP